MKIMRRHFDDHLCDSFKINEVGIRLSKESKRFFKTTMRNISSQINEPHKIHLTFMSYNQSIEGILEVSTKKNTYYSSYTGDEPITIYSLLEEDIYEQLSYSSKRLKYYGQKFKFNKSRSSKALSVVTGQLIPRKWDSKNKPIEFSIFSYYRGEIKVEFSYDSRELMCLLYKSVEAKGLIKEDNNGQSSIELIDIQEIKDTDTSICSPTPHFFTEQQQAC
ncbi:MAG: hypothetical protein CME69_02655 [Halobacteriovorax sp.]|nr:hypothetical protein [Halobacteriovorax sp.]|tara:strand:+ start:509 stop:1168 length:660 start_codon:yes stop_codon:yes gene_type:complete